MVRRPGVLALVIVIHAGAIWLLHSLRRDAESTDATDRLSPLELISINPEPRSALNEKSPHGYSITLPPPPPVRASFPPRVEFDIGSVQPEKSPPALDFYSDLGSIAQARIAKSQEQQRQRDAIGSIHEPSEPEGSARGKTFDWDEKRTHRVQVLPAGGLVIWLNDNCKLGIGFWVAISCAIGK
jgi:hypothetical protein